MLLIVRPASPQAHQSCDDGFSKFCHLIEYTGITCESKMKLMASHSSMPTNGRFPRANICTARQDQRGLRISCSKSRLSQASRRPVCWPNTMGSLSEWKKFISFHVYHCSDSLILGINAGETLLGTSTELLKAALAASMRPCK